MLNQMRSGAGNFAAKLLLGLLILSFAVWGVGDMVGGPSMHSTVATVGSSSISQRTFLGAYKRELEAIQSSLGASYSPELVKQMGLPQQVLNKIINRSLIEHESARLGLIPSDADIAQRIRSTPAFQSGKGKFDKALFTEILRRNGLSEKDYTAQLRSQMATELLMGAVNDSAPVSDAAIATIYRALEEQRTAMLYTLPASSVVVPEPDSAQIDAYYTAHGSQYSTPEFRKLSYMVLKGADMVKKAQVSDADLEAAYHERAEEFKRPEQRTVEQILFDNEEAAKKAAAFIASGKSFAQAAKESGKKPMPMGNVAQTNVPDEAAESVFALKEGASTDPIKTAFGWHIFHVSKIDAPKTLSLAEAREFLEKDAKQRAAETELNKISNQIEDALAGGSTLADVAKENGLEVRSLPEIDSQGKGKDGAALKDLPALDKFLDVAFKTQEKSESSLTSSKGGEYYIVRVESITPERVLPLEQVKPRVVEGWKKEERAKLLAGMAKDIEAKFVDEKTRAEMISKHGLKGSLSEPLKRDSENKSIPAGLLADIFERTPGKATGMYPQASGDYMIAVTKDIIPSKAMPPEKIQQNIRASLENSSKNELIEQYLDYLKTKHAVSIDQDALHAVTRE